MLHSLHILLVIVYKQSFLYINKLICDKDKIFQCTPSEPTAYHRFWNTALGYTISTSPGIDKQYLRLSLTRRQPFPSLRRPIVHLKQLLL
jgi:hypothetical protein